MLLLLSVLLFSVLQIQLATSFERDAEDDCVNMFYVSSYDEEIPQGIQVLDALKAQSKLNSHNSIPIVLRRIHAVKPIVEMMIKIKSPERYAQDQLVLGQHLSIEVFNDACRWLKDSGLTDQETLDCNVLQLKTLISHMDQYNYYDEAIKDSLLAARSELNAASTTFHYCSWIHNRIPGHCDQNQTSRFVVNDILCSMNTECSKQLCMNSIHD